MNFWKIVNKVIEVSDIVLMIVDSRMPTETRNEEIENKVKAKGKKLIIVYNKCDLADPGYGRFKLCTRKKLGTTLLKKKILALAKGKDPIVGVVGYPNTGKSSVINALAGRAKARASSVSGFTKGIQKIRAGRILLLDTPGVIPYEKKDEATMAVIGAIDFSKVSDPEGAVYRLMEKFPGVVEDHYGSEDLEIIAGKLGKLRKGGVADIDTTARIILKDWQNGKISIADP